jgi:hypothetical protein
LDEFLIPSLQHKQGCTWVLKTLCVHHSIALAAGDENPCILPFPGKAVFVTYGCVPWLRIKSFPDAENAKEMF